jgi:hypothetical protein
MKSNPVGETGSGFFWRMRVPGRGDPGPQMGGPTNFSSSPMGAHVNRHEGVGSLPASGHRTAGSTADTGHGCCGRD